MATKVHAVGTVIENELGEILLLKRHKNDPEGETWGLVGGKIDTGESSLQAAVRETYEEIGLQIKSDQLQFIKSYHWDREDLDIHFEVFKAAVSNLNTEFILPENEITEYLWIYPREALNRPDLMTGLYPILKDLQNNE